MRTPETSSPEGREKRSTEIFVYVYDALAKLERAGTLPEGKVTEKMLSCTAEELTSYAKRVLADEPFWASLPEDIPTRVEGYTKKKEELKALLENLLKE